MKATRFGKNGSICDGTSGDSTQLIFLRARWYNPADGRFQSRDTWDGDENKPMSMNRWMYGYGNPINLTDPTGHKPLGLGYVEGLSVSIANDFSTTFGLVDGTISGAEIVYDYATMTRARFAYTGEVTGAITGVSAAIYAGVINGFGYKLGDVQSAQINDDYKGTFVGGYGGIGIRGVGVTPGPGLMVGVGYFQNPEGTLKGEFAYGSAGVGLLPVEGMGFRTNYLIDRYSLPGNKNGVEFYADESGHVNRGKLRDSATSLDQERNKSE